MLADYRSLPSVSAVVACYLDGRAIHEMHQRLSNTFTRIGCDYEIIFVNDASPDDSQATIVSITREDPRVVGVKHSRNFGSQMAFMSGMKLATKDAVVLLDGDLQDPPEVIAELYSKFIEGFDVVYGIRTKRAMIWPLNILYRSFYRVYSRLSDFEIPRDAGDFSMISRRVVEQLLRFRERDLFLRGLRAYVGFSQTGVSYFRPERKFGKSTNNIRRNLLWARMAIFSATSRPLTLLTELGFAIFLSSGALGIFLSISRFFFDQNPLPGIAMVALLVVFFGGLNMLGLGIIGEYVAKIIQEVKNRPAPIRESVVRLGEIETVVEKD